MQKTYMAISFGKVKEYGFVIPYTEVASKELHEQFCEEDERAKILYDGPDIKKARKAVSKLKSLEVALGELSGDYTAEALGILVRHLVAHQIES